MIRPTPSLLAAAAAAAILAIAGCDSGDPRPVSRPDPTQSSLQAAPALVVADGVAVATLTATARDASGVALAGRVAVFEVTGAANALSAAQATTDADGVATVMVASTRAEAKTARVTIAGVQVAQAAALAFVAGPASAGTSTVAAAPATAPADGVTQVTVTATALDAHGNPVPGLAVDFAATGGTFANAQGTTDASGVASVSLTSTIAGGVTVSASAGGASLGAPQPVSFTAGAAASLALTAQPEGGVAGVSLADLVLEARDGTGNLVPFPAAVTVSLLSAPSGAVLGGTTTAAPAGPTATFSGLSVQRAGAYQLRVESGALQVDGATFSVDAGPAAAVVLTASPAGQVVAGAAFGATAELRDAFGNVVPSGASVSLALSPGGVLLGTVSVAAVNGVATFGGLSIESAGSYGLVAASGALSSVPSPSFGVVAAAAARLAFAQSPAASATAGAALTPAPAVVVQDAFGNPVASTADLVSLALQGGAPGATLGGTTSGLTVLGELTFADLTVDLAGAGYRLVASAAGLADAVSGAFAISSAAADPTTSEVAAAPATQTAGEDVVLTATVRDFFGNPVEGAAVTFATTAPDSTFSQPPASDASGVAAGSFTSTRSGAATATGSVGGGLPFAGTATVTFEPGAPSAVASTLVAAPESADADGTTAIVLTTTARDEFGNAVPGALVALASSGDATFVQPGPTDASGVSAGSIRSTAVGLQDVTAAAGGNFIAGAVVVFLTLDPDGDGIPKPEDAFPDDPTRFASYQTVLLPGLGGSFATATAINASNVVVGLSEDGSGLLTGARWTVSGTTASAGQALAPLAGNAYSAAYAVDASGAIVGESERGAEYVAVIWEPGAAVPIDLRLGGFGSPSAAYGISGPRIVGEAGQGAGSAAVLWADLDAVPVELPSLGGDRGAAYAIAGSLVVGESNVTVGGASVGVAWVLDGAGNPGPAVPLSPLAGHVSSLALGVDASGRIVGESESGAGVVHAVSWTVAAPAAPVDLGSGSAQGVNAGGRIAGHGGAPVGPIVWDIRNPALLEGVLVDPFLFSQGYALNGANVVVGLLDDGAFAAVPVSP